MKQRSVIDSDTNAIEEDTLSFCSTHLSYKHHLGGVSRQQCDRFRIVALVDQIRAQFDDETGFVNVDETRRIFNLRVRKSQRDYSSVPSTKGLGGRRKMHYSTVRVCVVDEEDILHYALYRFVHFHGNVILELLVDRRRYQCGNFWTHSVLDLKHRAVHAVVQHSLE